MKTFLLLTKILIHRGHGGYGSFSGEFYHEFARTYGIDFKSLPSYDPFHDVKHQNEHISSRYDPRLIDIFEKLGKDRCFEKIPEQPYRTSSLTIVEIPTMLLDAFYISDYDGAEWIWCNISKKYKDVFLDALNTEKKLPTIQHKLDEITQCENFLTENDIYFV
jgi:hypothetical protein